MAQERIPIDISNEPALVKLAEEASASGVSFVLQVGSEDVAILTPARKAKRKGGKALTTEDALFRLVGIGSSGIPGGISGNKHEALLRAKRSHSS
jgi:hypothetical protein